ncbi:MAG: hypothetical protein NVSMB63_00660 [Sediminibacterium sp.]
MKQLSLFRILSYVLVPVAALFGCMGFFFLLTALTNPAMLLIVFLFSSLTIYCFASLSFLSKGIDRGMQCKPSLRDWIRVNAYVSLFVGLMFFANSLSVFLMGPIALRAFVAQALETQTNLPAGVGPDLFIRIMQFVAGFMLCVSIILLVHIFINFRLMKIYRHVFGEPHNE